MTIFNFSYSTVSSLFLINSFFSFLHFLSLPLPECQHPFGSATIFPPPDLFHLSRITLFLRLAKYFLYNNSHWQATFLFHLALLKHFLNRRYEDKNGLFLDLLLIWDLVNSVAAGDSSSHSAAAGDKNSAGSEACGFPPLWTVIPF